MTTGKMYLTQSEAEALGLPSAQEQIERYNRAVLGALAALSQNKTYLADVAYAKSVLRNSLLSEDVKPFKINADSAVIYRLPFAMVNTECEVWFKRHSELTQEEIAGSRQIEISGKWYMGIRCATTARARELAARPVGPQMCNPFAA